MIKLSHILAENMRRFGTKNLNEQKPENPHSALSAEYDEFEEKNMLYPITKKEHIEEEDLNVMHIAMAKDIGGNYNFLIRQSPEVPKDADGNYNYVIQIQSALDAKLNRPMKPFSTPTYSPKIYKNGGNGYETLEDAKKKLKELEDAAKQSRSTTTNVSSMSKEQKIKYYQDELKKLQAD